MRRRTDENVSEVGGKGQTMSLSTYTVSFFGHREIPNMLTLEDGLLRIIRDIITDHEYVEFLVGRNGNFNQLAASTIRQAIRKYGCGNAARILVLPYSKAEYRDNQREYHEYYDEVEICTASFQAHPKAAIQVRNKAMVDRSDLVLCYIQHKNGGAYKTIKYAEEQGKTIVNLAAEY